MESHPPSAARSPISAKDVHFENVRRSVTYHPSVWDDYFLVHASNFTESSTSEVGELQKWKEEVRKLLVTTPDNSIHKIELIDAIQRLGVAYHFEDEIEISLKSIYDTNYSECNGKEDNDLHMVALRFRLLRQQGYNLSSADVFNKFIDHERKFKKSSINNVQGILSLYEAAHMGIQGEETLDEALEFSSSHLNSMNQIHMSKSLATQINEALKTPIRKTYVRLGAKKFLTIYQDDDSHNEVLLKFAKLDFNYVQKIHQKELIDVTRWWKTLDFKNKLPFVRDRVVENFFWAVSDYFEPQYHLSRIFLTKVITVITVIDDIYDVYGSINDLELFTNAIERWDYDSFNNLPTYMRHIYKALLDVYTEIEDENLKLGISYPIRYAKEEMKEMISAYYEEAKWSYNNYIPTMKEYMNVAFRAVGSTMLFTASLAGMRNLVSKEEFDWVVSKPSMILATVPIGRLMNDMTGHGFEQKISAVDCYMNENGASKEEAFAEFKKQIKKAWKDINQECLQPTAVRGTILVRALNFARLMELTYGHGEDAYTNSKNKTKGYIQYLFVEPVSV
ncbi:hypothetical protein BUALT_Bualt15G0026000 [Buddleja alternifolia]|uniref:Uncharacterized protein n=1 Tax=Buddleja alternifolia TaxID=168488 RepID=A0AAV6WL58_9LAMI|nr:hypothetical protein BUALT_Bualt15G0026000 [Buddleja alternifolia]